MQTRYQTLSAPLHSKARLDSLAFRVFSDLTEKGYFVVEEQNFGADLAVYKTDPEIVNNHAEYLVFLKPQAKLYTINRLATILKKKVLMGLSRPFGSLKTGKVS